MSDISRELMMIRVFQEISSIIVNNKLKRDEVGTIIGKLIECCKYADEQTSYKNLKNE